MDQRAHERKPLRIQVELAMAGRPAVALRTTDISVGGIGLVAAANPPAGLVAELRLPLPQRGGGLQVFSVKVRVQHSVFSARENGFRIGMAFVQPSDALVVAVGEYLVR
jgi:c-di-GMP-binding flagellar brake protein YcgR